MKMLMLCSLLLGLVLIGQESSACDLLGNASEPDQQGSSALADDHCSNAEGADARGVVAVVFGTDADACDDCGRFVNSGSSFGVISESVYFGIPSSANLRGQVQQ